MTMPPPPPMPSDGEMPPPPPPGGPAGALNIEEAFGFAWKQTWRNFGAFLVMILVAVLVVCAVVLLMPSGAGIVVRLMMSVLSMVVLFAVQLGMFRAALAVTAGERARISHMLDFTDAGSYLVVAIITSVLVNIGQMLCVLPGVIVGALLWFAPFVVLGGREKNPINAISRSVQLWGRQPGATILVMILGGVALTLGALLCGVGLLVAWPLSLILSAYTYRSLEGQAVVEAP